jgi:hypothetical protein
MIILGLNEHGVGKTAKDCFFWVVPIISGQKNIRAKVGGIIPKGPNISGAFLRRGLAKEKISGFISG